MVASRVVLLGDSLGMPRPMDELEYEDTYPYIISMECPECEFIPRFSRARDSQFQASDQQLNDDVLWLNPDVLCIHLGIVDCAPRLFNKQAQFILGRLPEILRSRVVSLCSKYRFFFTKNFPKVYVSKKRFSVNLEKILAVGRQVNARILIVGIMMPPERVCARSYSFKENVIQYNRMLYELSKSKECGFIDVNTFLDPEVHLCEDGIHLNKVGNTALAESIIGAIHANI